MKQILSLDLLTEVVTDPHQGQNQGTLNENGRLSENSIDFRAFPSVKPSTVLGD